jgi:Fe-S oxidoreductase
MGWHLGFWLLHLGVVSATLITVPVGSLVHVLTGPLNVLFSPIDTPMGRLAPIPEGQADEPIYASRIQDLTWKQLLDGDACTECGRCQDACPAFASGTPLSPKRLVLSIRDALHRLAEARRGGDQDELLLAGGIISDDALWSCTTCAACIQECPVLVAHVDAIVDMRRYLVVEGRVDDQLQEALANLGRYGNSFGKPERMRARWAQTLEPKLKDARREPVESLWFVGDYASYSPALSDITLKTSEVLRKIGLDLGILYDGERNAGNDARRVGEEGLFEMLSEKNATTLGRCKYGRIITSDPHTYNTLKNEYGVNGNGPHRVMHTAEVLDEAIQSGALGLRGQLGHRVTYHDACYLGRYNGVYDAPRRVIQATGCTLVEMPRHGDRAACCGAGGGRIWMKESDVGERPSEARVREAASLGGVDTLVVACPKDVAMFRDATKTTGTEDRLVIRDLMELVHEAL